jgi:hypothetical protein
MNPETQQSFEESAQDFKTHALMLAQTLEQYCYDIPDFTEIDRYLKFAEGSIKRARKIIKVETQGREVNRKRQIEKTKNQ